MLWCGVSSAVLFLMRKQQQQKQNYPLVGQYFGNRNLYISAKWHNYVATDTNKRKILKKETVQIDHLYILVNKEMAGL